MARPSDAWPTYLAIATVGYVVYGLGAVGPYLRDRLVLSDTQVGLHSSALAIGFVIAGLVAGRAGARFGELPVRGAALAVIALAVVGLAWAPTVVITLAASLAIGVGAGTVLGYANASLGAPGGSLARIRLARANVWAMVAAFVVPVLLAAGASGGPGWAIGLAPALVLVVVDVDDLRAGPRATLSTAGDGGHLPGGFWMAWAYLVAAVATEFCIVFWAATLVERRASLATSEASLVAALFLAGMFAGRLGLSSGVGTGGDIRRPAAIGLGLAILGAGVTWVSTVGLVSGAGLFVAGVGVSALYPVGVAAALAAAPDRLAAAGARLTLASGVAILIAPLALGAIADLTGVVAGWALVLVIAVAALGLSTQLRGPAPGAVEA